MQTEQQNALETPPQVESDESKVSKRGGKRPGAGRKPNLAKRLLRGFSRDAIAEAMADVDVRMVITSLLKSKRERTKLEALIFVRDTLMGRPAQNVSLSGGSTRTRPGAHWRASAMTKWRCSINSQRNLQGRSSMPRRMARIIK